MPQPMRCDSFDNSVVRPEPYSGPFSALGQGRSAAPGGNPSRGLAEAGCASRQPRVGAVLPSPRAWSRSSVWLHALGWARGFIAAQLPPFSSAARPLLSRAPLGSFIEAERVSAAASHVLAWLFAAHVLGLVQPRGGTHWVGRVASQWLDFRPFSVPLGRSCREPRSAVSSRLSESVQQPATCWRGFSQPACWVPFSNAAARTGLDAWPHSGSTSALPQCRSAAPV